MKLQAWLSVLLFFFDESDEAPALRSKQQNAGLSVASRPAPGPVFRRPTRAVDAKAQPSMDLHATNAARL